MNRINVNGRAMETGPVESDTPLLWVLRENLGMCGTKFGCGMGLCGACTVLLDGQAIRSCSTPVSVVQAKAVVTTVEGVHRSKVGAVVQEQWQRFAVPQCGYCQSGQIMSAVALLQVNASPTEQQIDEAMSGNICRCGTYAQIRQAIQAAAAVLRAGRTA